MSTVDLPVLTDKDFNNHQDVKWCPGCGDYSILAQVRKVLPRLGRAREDFLFISGIGCSSRFPYYMNTYGFHSIHGRAPALATGAKLANSDMQVWVITGDGDALSIGGNHLMHVIRRNVNLNIILFNNRIYGLTKGQYSPTSQQGKTTKSTPYGSLDNPILPLSVAIGCEATFVARTIDNNTKHMQYVLETAAAHKGTSFIEVYQNCVVFNNAAFKYASDKRAEGYEDKVIYLEHQKPILFGKNQEKGLQLTSSYRLEIVNVADVGKDDILWHDEFTEDPTVAFQLARMEQPDFPEPFGIFRNVNRPVYDEEVQQQVDKVVKDKGEGDLESLLHGSETWRVEA